MAKTNAGALALDDIARVLVQNYWGGQLRVWDYDGSNGDGVRLHHFVVIADGWAVVCFADGTWEQAYLDLGVRDALLDDPSLANAYNELSASEVRKLMSILEEGLPE